MTGEVRYAVGLVRTVPARRRRRVAIRLAARMGADPERIRALLGRDPGPITKPIAELAAAQIFNYFVEEGIDVELIEVAPEEKPDAFKTSTNLKLTSVVYRNPPPPTATGSWPDSASWSAPSGSDWGSDPASEQDRNYAVRLIVRVPPQRIEGLIKRLADRLQVDPERLHRLLSRPPGLLSKPITRATSERITSILSAEGVAVESVHLVEEGDGGPESPDFDLRLTLDMARMRARVGETERARPAADRPSARTPDRRGAAVIGSDAPPTAAAPASDPPPTAAAPASDPPPTAAANRGSDDPRAGTSAPAPEGGAAPAVAPPDRPRRGRRGAAEPTVTPPVDLPTPGGEAAPPPPRAAAPPPEVPAATPRVEAPARPIPSRPAAGGSATSDDVELPFVPLRPPDRSERSRAPERQPDPRPPRERPAAPPAPPTGGRARRRSRRAAAPPAPSQGGAIAAEGRPVAAPPVAPAPSVGRVRPEGRRRGLLTLLAFDLALIALLGSAGDALTTPGGVTVLLLFSLLLLGQAMLTRGERPLSNLFAGLSVAPMFFMFPALVDTLSPWRELTPDLQLVVIGLLLILSTLYLADTLGLDRHDLGLALWRRDRSGAKGGGRALRSLGAVVGGLLLQLLIGGSGLLVGVAALRLLPGRLDAFGLAGTLPVLAFTALLLTGLAQELFFRGLLQRLAAGAFRVPLGIGLSALLFMLLYAGGPLGGSLLFALALALASGVVAQLSGSVVGLGLMNALALAVYLGLLGDPSVCLQSGLDLGCLLPDLFVALGGLP